MYVFTTHCGITTHFRCKITTFFLIVQIILQKFANVRFFLYLCTRFKSYEEIPINIMCGCDGDGGL